MPESAAPTVVRRTVRAARAVAMLVLVSGCGRTATAPPRAFDPDSVPDAYRVPSAALMWPGATRAFEVTPAGDLCNGAWTVRIRPAADGLAADGPRRIAFEERWLPIAHWIRGSGPVRWSFEAVPFPPEAAGGASEPRFRWWERLGVRLPEPAPRDSGLFVSLEVEAMNRGASAATAELDVTFEPPDSRAAFPGTKHCAWRRKSLPIRSARSIRLPAKSSG